MTSGRDELTDEQWDKIKHYFEVAKKNGRPYKDVRNMVNGIVWILKSGAPWRDLPARYGQWNAVYKFSKWQEQGLFEKIFEELIAAQEAVACIKPRRNRRVAISLNVSFRSLNATEELPLVTKSSPNVFLPSYILLVFLFGYFDLFNTP